MTEPVVLDWRTHKTGPTRPCRICRRPAMLRDENDVPCHKTCAEAQANRPRPKD